MATRRGRMRDQLIRSIQNIASAASHLIVFYNTYKDDYPDIAIYVGNIIDALKVISENIQSVYDNI